MSRESAVYATPIAPHLTRYLNKSDRFEITQPTQTKPSAITKDIIERLKTKRPEWFRLVAKAQTASQTQKPLAFKLKPNTPALNTVGKVHIGPYTIDRLGLGCMRLVSTDAPGDDTEETIQAIGAPTDLQRRKDAFLHAKVGCGIQYFDVARGYGPWGGYGESVLREWAHPFQERSQPNQRILWSSKVGYNRTDDGDWHVDLAPQKIELDVELSCGPGQIPLMYLVLRGTDDVTVYNRPQNIEDSLKPLSVAKEAKKIDMIGLANATADEIEELSQTTDIAAVQNRFSLAHLFDKDAVNALKMCIQKDIPFVTWGIFNEGKEESSSDLSRKVDEAAQELGISSKELTIALLLKVAPNIVVLPGASSVGSISSCVFAANYEVPEYIYKRFGFPDLHV